ncbi:hypothetical protein H9651_11195 [Microbacterium sp. Sa4CUA7]|uniref:Uncharacterized protein n=1 Tax=Microbacterium pullorum TaxID=2762236 RepID=A0ABR8S401_9MICO|nr:hypothetical protein [Microbacterium pullorum]MBD7958206.1 hypothetical protein [Microbacterium pullorum]
MAADDAASDAALFRALRQTWEQVDPVPTDLVDRMVAVVAAADLSREYALLSLVEGEAHAALRGDAEMLTLQFSDGTSSVLIHTTENESGGRRIDGWVDAAATEVVLLRDDADESAVAVQHGRFAFADVPAGVLRLRVVLAGAAPDGAAALTTPRFEI